MPGVDVKVGPFAPINATSATLWYEQASIDGDSLGDVLYGIVLTIFAMTVPLLWKSRKERPRYSYCTLAFASAVFVCATLAAFGTMHYEERVFVDDVNFPGGPVAFDILVNDMLSYTAITFGIWLQDAIMIWRFFVFFGYAWWLAIIPAMAYMTTVVLSLLGLVKLYQGKTYLEIFQLPVIYFSISGATTLILSVAIVGRLLYLRRRLHRSVGRSHNAPYLSVSAMIIESAFISSAVAFPQAILMGTHNTAQILAVKITAQSQAIAPLLIIFRVAQGAAFANESNNTPSNKYSTRGTGLGSTGPVRSAATSTSGAIRFVQMNELGAQATKTEEDLTVKAPRDAYFGFERPVKGEEYGANAV